MKKNVTLLLFACTALLFGLQWGGKHIHPTKFDLSGGESFEEEEEKPRGVAGAAEWYHRIRANNETGVMDWKAMYKARRKSNEIIAQKTDANSVAWQSMGPNNVGGRTRAFVIDRNNANHLITGGVAGGIYTSTDGGANWEPSPQNDQLASVAIASGVQAPNGDIYLGTGEGFYTFFGSGAGGVPGEGILKSTDGGNTFSFLPATAPSNANNSGDAWAAVNKLAVHPTQGWIYAAISGGIRMSTDGGNTWAAPNGIDASLDEGWDVKTGSNGNVYAFVKNRYYRSTNGSDFELLSGSDPGDFPGSGNRKTVAVSPSDPNYLYAVIADNGGCTQEVLKSTDGGVVWYTIGEGSNAFEPAANGALCQGDYDLCIAVDPFNKDMIYLGGVTLWRWRLNNGWEQVDNLFDSPDNSMYVHADKHDIVFDPTQNGRLYVVCDGGVFKTSNASAASPSFIPRNTRYNVTQFYSIGASWEGAVMGGAQDNGTQFVGLTGTNSQFAATEVQGGDGGFADISKILPNVYFAGTPNGDLTRSTNYGQSFGAFYEAFMDMTNAEFVTKFFLWEDPAQMGLPIGTTSPDDINAKFICGNGSGKIYLTKQPLLLSSTPSWEEIGTFTGAGSKSVTAVSISKDGNYAIAGSGAGKVFIVKDLDQGPPYTDNDIEIANSLLGGSRYVTSVSFGVTSDEAIVTMGNYGNTEYIFKISGIINASSASTLTITSLQANLPTMPVYDACFDPYNNGRVIAGTEMGVWVYENGEWTPQTTGIGNVPVFRVRFEAMRNKDCQVLYVGSHGAGMFRSTTFTPADCDTDLPEFNPVATENIDSNEPTINVFPVPMTDRGYVQVYLPYAADVSLSIYDLQGRVVQQTQQLGQHGIGVHNFDIQRRQMSSGIYLIKIQVGEYSGVKKLVIK